MSFLKKIFGGSNEPENQQVNNPNNITFGRYSDKGKSKKQLVYWEKATASYKEKKYYDGFLHFLNYVKDEKINNLSINEISGEELEFEFIQGSKIIKGKANNNHFSAIASIVKMPKSNTAVMRKLMKKNYDLKYAKFSLNESIVYLKFSTNALDASPFKLYDALKELARNADKQDDLLVAEFSSLEEIDTHKTIAISPEIKELKYSYLNKWIKDTINECDKLDENKFSGGISFMLLNLLYKIDYLIVPEGDLTDRLEKMYKQYFAKNDSSTIHRNKDLIKGFQEVLKEPKDKILDGFYATKSTFPFLNPAMRKTVMDKVYDEKKKIQWYKDNKYPLVVNKMYEYIWGYSFFNYGMDKPDRELFGLLFNLYNQDYYSDLGIKPVLIEGEKLNEKEIKNRINSIIAIAKENYPNLTIQTSLLKYDNLITFSDSLIDQMDKMNYSK